MRTDLEFPALPDERMDILNKARRPFAYSTMTHDEKVAYVRGLNDGFYQGARHQAREIIDKFATSVVGFTP